MFYPIGFGGQHWFLYLIVPAILGIWAQIRVTGAFNRWGKVRASSNITGAECAREILQAAQIHDVNVVETNDFLGDHYDPTRNSCTCRATFITRPRWRRWVLLRMRPGMRFNTQKLMLH